MESESHLPFAPLPVAPYEYGPLDPTTQQIRLMHVRKNEQGVIHCSLTTFSLESLPPYVSLSYVWGPPTPIHRINLNDGYLDIRENLFNFLDEYCNEEQKQYIWIDQICINQRDTQERGHQVGMMAQVYSQALYVVVWLGNDKSYQKAALELIMGAHLNDYEKVWRMGILMRDVYFERLWVVQEFLLAKEVRFMLRECIWLNWTTMGKEKWTDLLNHISLPWMSKYGWREWGFLRYLENFGSKKCQNPLDRVYALLGLVGKQARIIPDYEKSAQELCVDVINILVTDNMVTQFIDTRPRFVNATVALGQSLGLNTVSFSAMKKLFWDLDAFVWSKNHVAIDFEIGFETEQAQRLDEVFEDTYDLPADRWWLSLNGGPKRYYYLD
jgi:hypothetical protein